MIPMLRTEPEDGWLTCPRCDGEGTIFRNPIQDEDCPECAGHGLINPEDDYHE